MRSKAWMILVGAVALAPLGVHRATAATPVVARGDFDRDGLRDTARIVREPDGRYRVVVQPGAKGQLPVVVYDFGRSRGDYYVARDTPGRYETACHKGYGPDAHEGRPCAHDYVVLTGDVFSFGVAESSEAVALWNGRRFEVVWISD
jgi:hypothetical protein